jgi:hypothetical protein
MTKIYITLITETIIPAGKFEINNEANTIIIDSELLYSINDISKIEFVHN